MKGFKRVTQVIYPKDLGLIVIISGISEGWRVLESGVGTGFLTATLANYVGDSGHVYAYEVRKEFIKAASRNLKKAGLEDRVTIKLRNINEGVDEEGLDAAFLDLPDPWKALPAVSRSLKPSAPLIIFVPSVNQIMKVLKAVQEGPYVDIHVYETIVREYQADPEALRPHTISIGHTGYVIFARLVRKG